MGKEKRLGEVMVATKFEPHDNWLPPGFHVSQQFEQALIDSGQSKFILKLYKTKYQMINVTRNAIFVTEIGLNYCEKKLF